MGGTLASFRHPFPSSDPQDEASWQPLDAWMKGWAETAPGFLGFISAASLSTKTFTTSFSTFGSELTIVKRRPTTRLLVTWRTSAFRDHASNVKWSVGIREDGSTDRGAWPFIFNTTLEHHTVAGSFHWIATQGPHTLQMIGKVDTGAVKQDANDTLALEVWEVPSG